MSTSGCVDVHASEHFEPAAREILQQPKMATARRTATQLALARD
jgi:hypothetical protein